MEKTKLQSNLEKNEDPHSHREETCTGMVIKLFLFSLLDYLSDE